MLRGTNYDYLNTTDRCEVGKATNNNTCEDCGVGMFSSDGISCMSCPDNQTAPAGSDDEEDCYYGKWSPGNTMSNPSII